MPNIQSPIEGLSNQNLESMYPDLFKKIKPHIDQIASELQGQNINENMISSIVEEILNRIGMPENQGQSAQPQWMSQFGDAIAVQRGMDYDDMYDEYYGHRNQYPDFRSRRRYPRYDDFSLEDFIRLMLLRRLYGFFPYY